LSFLSRIIQWVAGLWTEIPVPVQEKIIEGVVNAFEAIFRHYYEASQKQRGEKEGVA
jgi:hypothetical protein